MSNFLDPINNAKSFVYKGIPRFLREQCCNSDQYIICYKYDVRGQILVFNQSDNTSRTYLQLQKGHFSLLVYAAVPYPHKSVTTPHNYGNTYHCSNQ